ASAAPDELRVLADRNVSERVRRPVRLRVAQGAAGEPPRRPASIDVLPGTPRGGIEEIERIEAAHVPRSALQFTDLITQAPVGHPVVIVPMRNERSLRQLTGNVALWTERGRRVQTVISNPWILRKQISDCVFAVIDHDQFSM